MSSSRYFCAFLHKCGLPGQYFVTFPNTKSHTNPSSSSCAYLMNTTGTFPDDGNAVLRIRICYIVFNVHGYVHRKNILIYIQQDATLHSLFYLETALYVFGGNSTHNQKRKQLYLQHLVFVTPLLLPAAIVEELKLV
jgi:hypothetical protein